MGSLGAQCRVPGHTHHTIKLFNGMALPTPPSAALKIRGINYTHPDFFHSRLKLSLKILSQHQPRREHPPIQQYTDTHPAHSSLCASAPRMQVQQPSWSGGSAAMCPGLPGGPRESAPQQAAPKMPQCLSRQPTASSDTSV